MKAQDVIKLICQAFDGVPQPGEITLRVAEAHDEYDYENNEKHRSLDYFGPWQEIPDRDLEQCQNALSYLCPTGMRYYLPAFMVWYLQNFNSEKVSTDNTLYALENYPTDEKLAAYQKERFSLFSASQLKACAAFVKYCAEDNSGFTDETYAQKKFQRHWFQYA